MDSTSRQELAHIRKDLEKMKALLGKIILMLETQSQVLTSHQTALTGEIWLMSAEGLLGSGVSVGLAIIALGLAALSLAYQFAYPIGWAAALVVVAIGVCFVFHYGVKYARLRRKKAEVERTIRQLSEQGDRAAKGLNVLHKQMDKTLADISGPRPQ